MKETNTIILVAFLLITLAGCASWRPVPLDPGFWQDKGKRVGVVFLTFPPAEVQLSATPLSTGMHPGPFITGDTWWDYPGYPGLPMLVHETRPLHYASQEQDAREFMAARDLFVKGLKDRGFESFNLEQRIDERSLQGFKGPSDDVVHECRDYRDIGKAAGADYLIVLGLRNYGTVCRYIDLNNYEVEVYAQVRGLMVESATNRVLWRTGASAGCTSRTVNAMCSRPDHVPVILDALSTLLGEAARETAREFFEATRP